MMLAQAVEAAQASESGAAAEIGVLLLFVFAVSIFLGVELISKVPSQLHTPLMSGSNAISGITIVGALLALCVLAAFAANVERHAFLGDDSFISFRYAKHLAEGQGLVWNPGDRVEGYTNFLWVLLMAAGLSVGVAPEGAGTLEQHHRVPAALQPGQPRPLAPGPVQLEAQHLGVETLRPVEVVDRYPRVVDALGLDHRTPPDAEPALIPSTWPLTRRQPLCPAATR